MLEAFGGSRLPPHLARISRLGSSSVIVYVSQPYYGRTPGIPPTTTTYQQKGGTVFFGNDMLHLIGRSLVGNNKTVLRMSLEMIRCNNRIGLFISDGSMLCKFPELVFFLSLTNSSIRIQVKIRRILPKRRCENL